MRVALQAQIRSAPAARRTTAAGIIAKPQGSRKFSEQRAARLTDTAAGITKTASRGAMASVSGTPIDGRRGIVAAAGESQNFASPEAAGTTPDPAPAAHPSVAALEAALLEYGVDARQLGLTYSEETVGYPGGSYTNKLITASFGPGKTENFGADLTLRNPKVAAAEILGLLGRRVMA